MKGKRNLEDLKFAMKILGAWYDFDNKYIKFLQELRLVFFSLVFVIIIISSYQSGIMNAMKTYFFLESGGFYVIVQAIFYRLNQKKIKNIIENLIKIHEKRTERWQLEIFHKYSNITWNVVIFFGMSAILFCVCYFICPAIYDIFLFTFTADGHQSEPFTFPYPLQDLTLKNRSFSYYAIMCTSCVWTANLNSLGYVVNTFHSIVCCYLCIEIRTLRKIISNGVKLNLHNDRNFMKTLISDHQDVICVFNDFKSVTGLPQAAMGAVGALLLTAYLYAIMRFTDNHLFLVVYALCFSIMLSVMFVCCFFGEMLQTQSAELFDSFCGIPWDEMSVKNRKDFSFILQQARKPMKLSWRGLMSVNLELFQFIINSCYSFLMLLNSMQ